MGDDSPVDYGYFDAATVQERLDLECEPIDAGMVGRNLEVAVMSDCAPESDLTTSEPIGDRLEEIIDRLDYVHDKYRKSPRPYYDEKLGTAINELRELVGVEEETWCFECEEETIQRYDEDGRYCTECGDQ